MPTTSGEPTRSHLPHLSPHLPHLSREFPHLSPETQNARNEHLPHLSPIACNALSVSRLKKSPKTRLSPHHSPTLPTNNQKTARKCHDFLPISPFPSPFVAAILPICRPHAARHSPSVGATFPICRREFPHLSALPSLSVGEISCNRLTVSQLAPPY